MRRRTKRRLWIWGSVGVVVLVIAAVYGWYRWNLRPVNLNATTPIAVNIEHGERVSAIAGQLESAKIIRSRWAFEAYLTLNGLRRKVEAGYYVLIPADPASTNARIITRGIVVNKAFLVPEGATIKQIEATASETWLRGTSLPAAMSDSYPNGFLAARPVGASLEGYLFPDTYEIAPSTTPHQLVAEMLDNFGRKVTPADSAGFAAEGLTLNQGLTLASMVEKEVSNPTDRPIVAQIFLKRLSIGMKLESNVTSIYALALDPSLGSTAALANVNSPYNTYKTVGLPPGPICNPSLESIDAVLHPASTSYLYFLTDKDGVAHYATTAAGHEANVAKYLGQ